MRFSCSRRSCKSKRVTSLFCLSGPAPLSTPMVSLWKTVQDPQAEWQRNPSGTEQAMERTRGYKGVRNTAIHHRSGGLTKLNLWKFLPLVHEPGLPRSGESSLDLTRSLLSSGWCDIPTWRKRTKWMGSSTRGVTTSLLYVGKELGGIPRIATICHPVNSTIKYTTVTWSKYLNRVVAILIRITQLSRILFIFSDLCACVIKRENYI